MGNDINPLSQVLLSPRLNPPTIKQIEERLEGIDLSKANEHYEDLLHFYHKDTLREIISLKEYLLKREEEEPIDNVDAWIRMVAINRVPAHSTGFLSVYSLPWFCEHCPCQNVFCLSVYGCVCIFLPFFPSKN